MDVGSCFRSGFRVVEFGGIMAQILMIPCLFYSFLHQHLIAL